MLTNSKTFVTKEETIDSITIDRTTIQVFMQYSVPGELSRLS